MKYEIEIPDGVIPEGWEPTGDFRKVRKGEWYFDGSPVTWGDIHPSSCSYLILRKVEPVRQSRWVNTYTPHGGPLASAIFTSRKECDADAYKPRRVGVIRIDYENGKPVSVTLEPVEEQ